MNQTKVRLLPTISAKVKRRDKKNKLIKCLVDTGSQTSLISSTLAERLKLKTMPSSVQVSGLGEMCVSLCTERVSVQLKPYYRPGFKLTGESIINKNLPSMLKVPNRPVAPLSQD
jgi:hypothetical protein